MITDGFIEIIQTASFLLIAYCAFFIAWLLYRGRREEKYKRTFDVLFDLNSKRLSILTETSDYSMERDPLEYILSSGDRDLRQDILDALNYHEAISIGVKNGFYAEDVMRDMLRGVFVNRYRNSQKIIEELRNQTKNPTLYINFEAIARRWEGGVF